MSSIKSMAHRLRIAVGQINASPHLEENFKNCVALMQKAAEKKADVLFLPEACDMLFDDASQLPDVLKKDALPDFERRIAQAASENNLWTLFGMHIKVPQEEKRCANGLLVVHPSPSPPAQLQGKGEGAASQTTQLYEKTHLFKSNLPGQPAIDESKTTMAGDQLRLAKLQVNDKALWQVGMAICFDLRFPYIGNYYREKGAHILTYPSAWTIPTASHWEPLLRARAIENQCIVVAPAQYGSHTEKRKSYGASMIVDGFGKVLVRLPHCKMVKEGEKESIHVIEEDTIGEYEKVGENFVGFAEVDQKELDELRQGMQLLECRRPELLSK